MKSTIHHFGKSFTRQALLVLSIAGVFFASARPASAELPDRKSELSSGIHHVYVQNGKLVKLPTTVVDIVQSDSQVQMEEGIDEPEYVWNRSMHSWTKNPRYGMVKAPAGYSRTLGTQTRKGG
jgi:hypothetical protein